MKLRVSDNHRFLQDETGRPFFYLADTAWELFHRLTLEEARDYLTTRAGQGFTAIQAVMLGEFDGLRTPNAYGRLPFAGEDPLRPDERPDGYWAHVDAVIRLANGLGLVVGALPTWGDKWNRAWGQGPEIFTPENARAYGLWLGRRYRDAALVWILGGDRPVETERHRAVIEAMAAGLREGDGGGHLITFHPAGGRGSAEVFHEASWLDFNMRQNGHETAWPRYANTHADYLREPAKPVIDGEPIYEGHPIAFHPAEHGLSLAADVRRALYWDLFGGACGHTYGHHSVWQFHDPERDRPVHNAPVVSWREALRAAGASQMVHARRLLESLPYFSRIPADELIVPDAQPAFVPGAGERRLVATRDANGVFALAYTPVGVPFSMRLDTLAARRCHARWMDPRTGEFRDIGDFPTALPVRFLPPTPGELLDWVLVLTAQGD